MTSPADFPSSSSAAKRRFGLKEKILIPLVCITGFILCGATFAVVKNAEQTLLKTAEGELLNAAETLGHNVDVQVQRAQMDVTGASYLIDLRRVLSPEETAAHDSRQQFVASVNRLLSAFIGAPNTYESFYVTCDKGRTLASSQIWTVGESSAAYHPWFHEALRVETAVTSSPYTSRFSKDTVITVAKKLTFNEYTGTVAGTLKLGSIVNAALNIGTNNKFLMALVTRTGHVLGSRDNTAETQLSLADQPWFATVAKGDQGYFPITEEGEEKILAYHRLRNTQLFSIAIARKSDLLGQAIFLRNMAFAVLLATLTAAYITIYHTVAPMIRAVRELAHTANKIGSGDLGQRIETDRKDELGDLALSFMSMLETLKKMIFEAEEATRAKSDFLARMSHEIRTPLNAIIGMAYLGLHNKKNTESQAAFAKIHDAASSLLRIVNDILDFSKIEANKINLQDEPFSLRNVVTATLGLVKGKADEKKLALSCTVDPEIPDILVGDALRLSQICTNLCANAVKFTDKGSVSVTVLIEECRKNIIRLKFTVADTGIGMTREQHRDIFEAFSQADGSITRRFGGTGLGLAICKRLVTLMGGSIWVQSSPGQGSVFHFTVSLGISPEQNLPAAPKSAQPETAPIKSARVLVVEDNKLNQEIAVGMLKLMGISPTIACNGQEAVDLCRSRIFDLVLMDIQMPVMDGLEATRQIRKYGFGKMRDVPIIAMTANALQADKFKSMEAGMNAHLTKPISHAELVEVIRFWYAGSPADSSAEV